MDPDTDCVCPAQCGKGTCKTAGGKLVCDTCRDGFVKFGGAGEKKCATKFTCKAGKVVTPPKYAGTACGCNDKNCNNCATTADGEICKSCRNSKFLFNEVCHDACADVKGETDLISMGTGAFKRRCFADPFSCIKGYFHDPTSGERIDTPHACRCPNKQGTKLEPNCHTCEFNKGGHGECTICKGRKLMHNGECLDSCEGTGLAKYLPSGQKGGVCRPAFECVGGVDQSNGESGGCECPRKLEYCADCVYGDAGHACTKCSPDSKRPYLHNGGCVKVCPKNNPAKQDESAGKQCS